MIKKSFFISLLLVVLMTASAGAEQTVYNGTADGFGGQPVKAVVTLEDGRVVDLNVDDSTQSYKLNGVESIKPLLDAIISAGKADGVDVVSGATVTSTAILSIVNDALSGGPADYSQVKVSYKPGTYVGTGRGRNGEVKVEVKFAADRIESINILSSSETPGISDIPSKKVPADIISYQSLGVDTITGATLTSNAILTAVADAAGQAGANVAALRAVAVEYHVEPVENLNTQIVVVGAGAAGLVAASKAVDEGADVVLLEKLPYLGGSLLVAAGGYATPETNKTMKAQGIENDFNETMEFVRNANAAAHHQPDYDFIEYLLKQTGETIDYLAGEVGIEARINPQSPAMHYVNVRLGGDRFGAGVVDALSAHLKAKGVKIVLNATAKKIMIEDVQVVGIKAAAPGGEFTVRAKKVIMATGGASYNKELMTSITPAMNRVTIDHQPLVGNTGDGWAMLNAVGAQEGAGPFLKPASTMSYAGALGYTWANNPSVNGTLIFDDNGIRYIREDQGVAQGVASGLTIEVLRHGSKASYALFDTHNVREDLLAKFKTYADNKMIVVYGKNIEEIADKLGIDRKTLRQTYDRYQYLCKTRLDVDQGKAERFLIPYNEDGGLFAAFIHPGSYGTIGGFITDKQFRVLDKQGQPIKNLFAVGEIATSTLFGDYYMGAFSLGYYATAGRIAAETAVAEIKK